MIIVNVQEFIQEVKSSAICPDDFDVVYSQFQEYQKNAMDTLIAFHNVLSPHTPKNFFSAEFPLEIYSNGMGALGMPGDWSSQSRFVKTAFLKLNSVCGPSEEESVNQFFHLLGAVEHPRGAVIMDNGLCEITLYSSCCNTDRGIYYYRTYENSGISAVDLHRENLDGSRLINYPLNKTPSFAFQN